MKEHEIREEELAEDKRSRRRVGEEGEFVEKGWAKCWSGRRETRQEAEKGINYISTNKKYWFEDPSLIIKQQNYLHKMFSNEEFTKICPSKLDFSTISLHTAFQLYR